MKSILVLLTLTFSINCFSQKQKNHTKDTLYLKSGEKVIDYYYRGPLIYVDLEFMCSKKFGKNTKNCKSYLRKDIDKIVYNTNGINGSKPENGILILKPLDFKQILTKKYRKCKPMGLPVLRLEGSTYDFYEGTLSFFEDLNFYVFITKPKSDKIIDFIFLGKKPDYKKLLKNADKRFKKCAAITQTLEQKKYKEDYFNVSKILDKCGEILTK